MSLVLTRRQDEWVDVEIPNVGRISVEVVAIRGDKVRLGFHAADAIEINRREVRLHNEQFARDEAAKAAKVGGA